MLGTAELAGTNGLLAVFAAGLLFRGAIAEEEDQSEEHVQEAVTDFFLLPVFVLLGLTLPWTVGRGRSARVRVLADSFPPILCALDPSGQITGYRQLRG